MTTKYFSLPEIDPNAPFDGANDINKLADSIDSALDIVATRGQDAKYNLPPATNTTLGGVVIGRGVNVSRDGTISVDVEPYNLPPATRTKLGGVKVNENSGGLKVSEDGTLGVDSNSLTLPDNSIDNQQIKNGAVTTTKIADGAVTLGKLESDLYGKISSGAGYVNGELKKIENFVFYRSNSATNASAIVDKSKFSVYTWGPLIVFKFDNCPFTITGSQKYGDLGYINDHKYNNADNFVGYYGSEPFPYYNQYGNIVGYVHISVETDNVNHFVNYYIKNNSNFTDGTYYLKGDAYLIYNTGA